MCVCVCVCLCVGVFECAYVHPNTDQPTHRPLLAQEERYTFSPETATNDVITPGSKKEHSSPGSSAAPSPPPPLSARNVASEEESTASANSGHEIAPVLLIYAHVSQVYDW